MKILNIAAYKFVEVPEADLPWIKERLRSSAIRQGLKGSVLLSTEGINMFLAGMPERINLFWTEVKRIGYYSDIIRKESLSDHQPFTRMLVKIKDEIIAMGKGEIDPSTADEARISPSELKRWLDEGKDFTLLDTRNDYEINLGTFEKAEHLDIPSFKQFPEAVKKMPEAVKEKPVVIFCTGGIRCEKAAPWMLENGFQEVYQLDGGILKYFEEQEDAHYDGGCFVFDQRVSLDGKLQVTGLQQCVRCLAPVTPEEQASPDFVLNKHCPHCVGQDAPLAGRVKS